MSTRRLPRGKQQRGDNHRLNLTPSTRGSTALACLFTNFYYYKGNEEAYARDERPIKAKVGMFVDYSWFVCLALTGKFLPTCYVLQITYKNIPTDTK